MYSTLFSLLFATLFAPDTRLDDTKVPLAPLVARVAQVQNVQVTPLVAHVSRTDPVNIAVGLVGDEKTVRRIGVTTRRPDEALSYHLSINPDEALVISSVQDDMPAAEAGLTVHDVIVSVGGSVPRSSDVLRDAVQANDTVLLLVRRGPKTVELRVPVREITVESIESKYLETLLRADPTVKGRVNTNNLFLELRERAEEERAGAEKRARELQLIEEKLAHADAEKARAYALKGVKDGALVEHVRSALRATEHAALEEARAKLARERANLEERRAEVEALRHSLASVDDSERKNMDESLLKLHAVATELGEKQKMLELKAGEALLRHGERSELVLPSDRTIFSFRNTQQGDDGRLEAIEERLDQLTALTKEILGILTNRSAR